MEPTSYFATVEHMLTQANTPELLSSVRQSLTKVNRELRKEHGVTQHPDMVTGHDLYVRLLRKLGQAIRRDQERGLIRTRVNITPTRTSKDFYGGSNERRFSFVLAEMSEEEFEAYLKAHRHRRYYVLNDSMRLANINGIGPSLQENRRAILQLAEEPGMTISEISARLGLSAHWVGRVLTGAKITIPMGKTYVPPEGANPKLDSTQVVQSTLEIINSVLPTLQQVDLTKVGPEVAKEAVGDLNIILSELRKLNKNLKEQM